MDDATEILTTRECWELLTRAAVARLAVVVDGHPDVFPVNHVVDGSIVTFRTGEGNKLESSLDRPVALEVDGYEPATASAWSVVLKGVGRAGPDHDGGTDRMPALPSPWEQGDKTHVVLIEPTQVSGRRVRVHGGAGPPHGSS